MSKYFDRFPVISYNGVSIRNILAKIDFTKQSKEDIYANFDHTLSEYNTRPDVLSQT